MKNDLYVKMIPMVSAIGLFLGLSSGSALAQTNLIVNGGFEVGPAGVNDFTDWDWLGPASNNSDYGVAHSGTFPDVAEQGNFYAYFHGHPTDSSQDCLGLRCGVRRVRIQDEPVDSAPRNCMVPLSRYFPVRRRQIGT